MFLEPVQLFEPFFRLCTIFLFETFFLFEPFFVLVPLLLFVAASEFQVFEQSFGGNVGIGSAYMLVYVQKSQLEQVLIPITENDVPKNLLAQLQKESNCTLL